MWLLIIRGLQIASIIAGLLGSGNAVMLAGRSFEGSGFDWFSTVAPLLAAAGSWAASHFLGWKLTTPALTELASAIVAYGTTRSDENKMRLLVAIIAVAKELVGSLEELTSLSKAIEGVQIKSAAMMAKQPGA